MGHERRAEGGLPLFARGPSAARRRRAAGFTLLELIIVVAVIGILATIAMPRLLEAPDRAKEAVLKTDLRTFRSVIDQYHADRGKYPASLEVLVEEGYLRQIPVDPVTRSADTWVPIFEELAPEEELPGIDGELAGPGIVDVRSGATGTGRDGREYSEG
jgi:general secretion pathway protein G